MGDHKEGYIYVIHNNSFEPNIYKCGQTINKDSLQSRYNTYYVDDIEIKGLAKVEDCVLGEKFLFHKLKNYRIKQRKELFRCELDVILKIMADVTDQIGGSVEISNTNITKPDLCETCSNKYDVKRTSDMETQTCITDIIGIEDETHSDKLIVKEFILDLLKKHEKDIGTDKNNVIKYFISKLYELFLQYVMDKEYDLYMHKIKFAILFASITQMKTTKITIDHVRNRGITIRNIEQLRNVVEYS